MEKREIKSVRSAAVEPCGAWSMTSRILSMETMKRITTMVTAACIAGTGDIRKRTWKQSGSLPESLDTYHLSRERGQYESINEH